MIRSAVHARTITGLLLPGFPGRQKSGPERPGTALQGPVLINPASISSVEENTVEIFLFAKTDPAVAGLLHIHVAELSAGHPETSGQQFYLPGRYIYLSGSSGTAFAAALTLESETVMVPGVGHVFFVLED